MLKVFESFAGVGSQRMALKNIGVEFEVVGISEVDKWALLSYDAIHNEQLEVEEKTIEDMLKEFKDKNIAYNFSTGKSEIPRKKDDIIKLYNAHIRSKNFGDIRLIDAKKLPDFDLFTYSFPCKNISIAGQQAGLEEGSETQSSLLWECRKIIDEKKPKYLLMENVKNLVGKKHKPFFDKWCKELEGKGYTNYWKVLNGKDFGVAQNRERVIMISILNDKGNFTMPLSSNRKKERIIDILEKNVDISYYLNKPFIFTDKFYLNSKPDALEQVAKTLETTFDQLTRVYNVDGICPTISARDGRGPRRVLINVALIDTLGFKSNKIVNSKVGLCPTLTNMKGGNRQPKILEYIEDESFFKENDIFCKEGYVVRKLTPLECWRLMGFKDEDYEKAKNVGLSKFALYERAGRGIVVPMLEEIFKNLFL